MRGLFKLDAQHRRRVLFVLANLAVLGLIVWSVVWPVATTFADRDARIQDQRRLLARLNAIAGQVAGLETLASETESELKSGEFLAGANENVIAADLQTKLKAILANVGAQTRAVQTLPIRTIDQLRYSGVRIDLSGPLPAVTRVVHAIESAKPYLFVTNATLKSAPGLRQAAVEEPQLQAQLDIYGAIQ
ncbi:type II secretion system protein GspM [Bradyrhizobium sp. HKCCYLS20291]|uniref:type II secretion system protein GspM n=1 Tax=Bradyrhizobium sp. HKCCYLS20291 TaxID=3420766 RepID=UPI003EC02D77